VNPGAKGQEGFLVIAAAILITVLGFIAVALTTMTAGSARGVTEYASGTKAFYIAEAGIEKGIYQWLADPAYAGEGPVLFGGGEFAIVVNSDGSSFASLGYPTPLPSGQAHLMSIGRHGNSVRTVHAIVEGGGSPIVLNGDFNSPGSCPPLPDSWTNFKQSWSKGNDCAALPNAGPDGSTAIYARSAKKDERVDMKQDLPVVCPGPATVTVTFAYRHTGQPGSSGEVEVLMKGKGVANIYNFSFSNTGGWQTHSYQFNIGANSNIGRVDRLQVTAKKPSSAATPSEAWIDDFNVEIDGCGGAGPTRVIAWREQVS